MACKTLSDMRWTAIFHDEFLPEFEELPEEVQEELAARMRWLEQFGPSLGRPNVDTLGGSCYPNMKELRFRLDGLWRFAFAFDPDRQAIVLVGGNKIGVSQARFYRDLIRTADTRFTTHLASLKRKA